MHRCSIFFSPEEQKPPNPSCHTFFSPFFFRPSSEERETEISLKDSTLDN